MRTNTLKYVCLIATFQLSSCASSHVAMFEKKYQNKDYAGALVVGNHILQEEGFLRSVRVRVDGDARRNKEDLLQKIENCKYQLKLEKQENRR